MQDSNKELVVVAAGGRDQSARGTVSNVFTPQTIISKLKYDLNTAKIAQYYYLSTNKKRRIGQSKSFQ